MTVAIIKVAPPNTHTSEFPRLTHEIAMAGAQDFKAAGVAFGIQIKPSDTTYEAVRVNPAFWRLHYRKEVRCVRRGGVLEFRDSGERLAETLAAWQGADPEFREVIATLKLARRASMAAALRDIRVNGRRYAFECTMGSALVRLFIARRGFIGTNAACEEWHEADKGFDDLYPSIYVEPSKGDISVPGMLWLNAANSVELGDVRQNTPKSLRIGDWLYLDHRVTLAKKGIRRNLPYAGQNAIWLGRGLFYAHDYGICSMDQYFEAVHKVDERLDLPSLEHETKVTLPLQSIDSPWDDEVGT